ncbi:MAG: HEAT repeat domain-containing protein [Planctomycetota bacterium]|nr:HEAT repeat domain-containing protein [Planctomycetota bacterium]
MKRSRCGLRCGGLRRIRCAGRWLVVFSLLAAFCPARALAVEYPQNELNQGGGYDEVIRDLLKNLSRDSTVAQDSALKLAKLGKRAVPVLTELLNANLAPEPKAEEKSAAPPPKGNPQLAFYAVVALSRIKAPEAAKPLMPLLNNDKARPELRTVAIEAMGLEFLEESAPVLQKIAAGDADSQLRKKAYGQLSIMPNFWARSEKLFVDALSDPDDDIRALAAKQCWYAPIYQSATDKLVELAEKDPQPPIRLNAMLALSRMRPRRAVPALVRVCVDADTAPAVQRQALHALNAITGVTLKDAKGLRTWWEKFGEAEYAKLEAPPKAPDAAVPPQRPPQPVSPPPDGAAPEKKPSP